MKVVVFESEPREAPIFDRLKPEHEVALVEEPLRANNVGRYAAAEIIQVSRRTHHAGQGDSHCLAARLGPASAGASLFQVKWSYTLDQYAPKAAANSSSSIGTPATPRPESAPRFHVRSI